MKPNSTSASNVVSIPVDRLLREGQSQQGRVVEEVMQRLFAGLPSNTSDKPDFSLSDGSVCWIKRFSEPRQDDNGDWVYGFDVTFQEGGPLSHLEFSVKCSGWERQLVTPTE